MAKRSRQSCKSKEPRRGEGDPLVNRTGSGYHSSPKGDKGYDRRKQKKNQDSW